MTKRGRVRRAVILVLLWWVLATGPQALAFERTRVVPPRRAHRAAAPEQAPTIAARRRTSPAEQRRARRRSA